MAIESNKRPVRSFVQRQRRITTAQQQAIGRLWPKFGLEDRDGQIDVDTIFGRSVKVVFEIGFGMGDSLIAMALEHPEINYIATEVHRPGVGALLHGIEKHGIENIRIYKEDAISILTNCIKNKTLDGIQIFFPDPWPKKRHHKRRLIQPKFLDLVHAKLKPGGRLHLATDSEDYAKHMMKVLTAHEGFRNEDGEGQFVKNKMLRPQTKFEKRGMRLGHSIQDLVFIRNTNQTQT